MCQDVLNARTKKIEVSLHVINKAALPLYHSGVDTIDAFCYSAHKKMTEQDLDKVYVNFLIK